MPAGGRVDHRIVAAKKIERDLGVTYKTAWCMCHMIRAYMGSLDSDDPLGGIGSTVEIDEALIGGSISGKGSGYKGNKICVVGLLERGGELITRVAPARDRVGRDMRRSFGYLHTQHCQISIDPGWAMGNGQSRCHADLSAGRLGFGHPGTLR